MPKRLCTQSGCKAHIDVPVGYRGSPRCELHNRPTHTPKRVYDHHYHDGKNIYKTTRWTKLRAAYAAHQPLCEHCLRNDIVTSGFIVDHIVEIEDGGAVYDWNNLAHLCMSCHNSKTAKEAQKRRRKKKNNGFGSLSDF